MSTATLPRPATAAAQPGTPLPVRLVTRSLLLRLATLLGCSLSFYLPLSVVPAYAGQSGSSGDAGLTTGALLLATVACELATPRLVRRFGHRRTLAVGLVLLGAPALLLLLSSATSLIVAVNVVRGAGFAICVVTGGALTAAVIPAQRRGAGLALAGLVSGLSSLIALPGGVWAAARFGYGPVFVATAAAALLALAAVPALGRTAAAVPSTTETHGVWAGLRNPELVKPAVIFAAATTAAGVVVTFLPIAVAPDTSWVVPAALFLHTATATGARCLAGRLGDGHGHTRLLAPGAALSVSGTAMLALTQSAVAVLIGVTVLSAGFGVLQNATQALMFARGGNLDAASALWNAAYDLGMAFGALGVGFLAGPLGFPLAFLATAAVMAPALLLAVGERRAA